MMTCEQQYSCSVQKFFCTSMLISSKCRAQFSMSRTTLGLLSLGLLDLGPKCQAFQFPPSLHIFHHSVSGNGLSNTEADMSLYSFKQETATCCEAVAVPGITSLWYYFGQTLYYRHCSSEQTCLSKSAVQWMVDIITQACR